MKKYILLVMLLATCHYPLVKAQTKEAIVKEWKNAPQQNCFVAQYNAPLGSIIEIKRYEMIVFAEVTQQCSNPKDSILYLSPCILSRFTQNVDNLALLSLKVNIKIQDQPQQGILVVNPALNAPIVSQSSNDNLGFQGLQSGGNTNLGFQGLQVQQGLQVENNNLDGNVNYTNPLPVTNYTINTIAVPFTERGLADVISILSNKPFVASHRTVPIGTLLNIRNVTNGNVCAVEVVTNVAPTQAGAVIGVSQAVFTRLGAAPGELLEVELKYFSPSTKSKTNSERIQVASFESKYLSTERVALHPSLPAGTVIRLGKMGSFTIMGKSKQANVLQIPINIYEKSPMKGEQFIHFGEASDDTLLINFTSNTNIIEEATASMYEQKSTEKMAVWHKTIPVGTTVCVERTFYQDENRIVKSRHLVKVVGTLSASAKEDMQLSSDAWQSLQKESFTVFKQNNGNNLGFQGLQTNNTEIMYQAPADAKVISVSIHYFAP